MTALALALALSAAADSSLSGQTQVFYNARLALRSHAPREVLQLWLLHNSLEQQGQRSVHETDFRSVVWAALGEAGLCADGFRPDEGGGARLWTVALHNWLVAVMGRGEPEAPSSPFEAFEAGQQQRLISLHDVLDVTELHSATFFPTACNQPQATLSALGLPPAGALSERYQVGLVLQSLLQHAQVTLNPNKVRHGNVLRARLFDLNLELTRLAAMDARRRSSEAVALALEKGVSSNALPDIRAAHDTCVSESPEAQFLREVMQWPTDDWLSLSEDRRLALFSRTKKCVSQQGRDEKGLALIDALIASRRGAEVEKWIRLLELDVGRRGLLFQNERGQRLLALDEGSGFKERGPIAIHRGVWLLEQGEQREALRSFAFALNASKDSSAASATAALARRWLTYVLGVYEANDDLVAVLKALIPPLEYNVVIEDLVWKAALRADAKSFERLVASARRGGAFDGRVEKLRPLSQGRASELLSQLRQEAADEPHAMLRFVNVLLEYVEREELPVRAGAMPWLKALLRLLDEAAGTGQLAKSQARKAQDLASRVQAILAGVGLLLESSEAKGRSLSWTQSAFAGSIRLAPVDALPWPFASLEPVSPSPFKPLVLEPVEWRVSGELVFGWSIHE